MELWNDDRGTRPWAAEGLKASSRRRVCEGMGALWPRLPLVQQHRFPTRWCGPEWCPQSLWCLWLTANVHAHTYLSCTWCSSRSSKRCTMRADSSRPRQNMTSQPQRPLAMSNTFCRLATGEGAWVVAADEMMAEARFSSW